MAEVSEDALEDLNTADEEEPQDESATQEDSAHLRPTRHAMIMRGIVTPILALIAVTCLVLGILNSTLWKPSHHIAATTPSLQTAYLVTDPGVLNLVDSQVQLHVKSSDSTAKLCVAIAHASDAQGWLKTETYTRVEGLSNWSSLKTSVSLQPSSNSAGDSQSSVGFADSDLWQSVECQEGSVELSQKVKDEHVVAIVYTDKPDFTVTLSLHWTREKVPNFAIPLYLMAVLLAICAVLAASVFAIDPSKRRKYALGSGVKSRVNRNEVQIGEALAGSLANLKSDICRRRPSRHGLHKHGYTHEESKNLELQDQKSQEESAEVAEKLEDASPRIVGIQESNMLESADSHGLGDSSVNVLSAETSLNASNSELESIDDSTTVISDEDFAAYFARLAAENALLNDVTSDSPGEESGSLADGLTDTASHDAAHEIVDEAVDEIVDEVSRDVVNDVIHVETQQDAQANSNEDDSGEDGMTEKSNSEAVDGEDGTKEKDE